MVNQLELLLSDELATEKFATALATIMIKHDFRSGKLYLSGNLGAGKTTFSRFFLRGLGVTQTVKSPTYTLIEPYLINDLMILHMDLYRLSSAYEIYDLGFLEDEEAIWLVEWPENGEGVLPLSDLDIVLERHSEQLAIKIKPNSQIGLSIIEGLLEASY